MRNQKSIVKSFSVSSIHTDAEVEVLRAVEIEKISGSVECPGGASRKTLTELH